MGSPPRLSSRIPAGALFTLLTSFAVQGSLLVTGIVMARVLGPADRGHFGLFALMAPATSSVLTLGLPLAATNYLAGRLDSGRSLARALVRPALLQAAAALAIGAAIVAGYALEGDRRLAIGALVTVASFPSWIATSYALAFAHALPGLKLFNAGRLLQALLFILFIVATGVATDWGLVGFAAAYTAAFTLSGVIILVASLRALPRAREEGPASLRPLLGFGLRALPGSLSPIDLIRVDQLMVAAVVTPSALGLYVAAQSVASVPRIIAQSVAMVAYPRVARVAQAGGDVGHEVRQFVGGAMLLAVPAAIVLALGAGLLVPVLFGHDFEGAVAPARFLLVASVFLGLRLIVGACARALGQGSIDSICEAILWVTLIPSILFLANLDGAEGAAIALAISSAVTSLTLGALFLFLAPHRRPAPLPALARLDSDFVPD